MGLLAKADCQQLIAEGLPNCFGCGYAALCQCGATNPSSRVVIPLKPSKGMRTRFSQERAHVPRTCEGLQIAEQRHRLSGPVMPVRTNIRIGPCTPLDRDSARPWGCFRIC